DRTDRATARAKGQAARLRQLGRLQAGRPDGEESGDRAVVHPPDRRAGGGRAEARSRRAAGADQGRGRQFRAEA
ncbi:hypothetical protein LTR94_038065, partial [Friedmanniomyces endolithicus]